MFIVVLRARESLQHSFEFASTYVLIVLERKFQPELKTSNVNLTIKGEKLD